MCSAKLKRGRLYDAKGQLFDTGKGAALLVIDARGLFARRLSLADDFHHSSFLAGEPVAGAGLMQARKGLLVDLNDRSGHYRPPEKLFQQVIDRLQALGVEIPK